MKWTILLLIGGIFYTILVQIDDSYNVVHLTEQFMNPKSRQTSSSSPSPLQPLPPSTPQPHHYAEF